MERAGGARGDGRGEPVGVGVVGEDERRALGARAREGAVHGALLFGVGKGDRGERGVGCALLGDARDPREAGGREHTPDERVAHAVHGGVNDGEIARAVARVHGEAQDRGDVGVLDRIGGDLHRVGRSARYVDGAGRAADGGRDARVDRRDDLRAVLPVNLVAVVLGRVVARGHHYAGGGAQLLHGEADEGCRHRLPEEQHLQACLGEDQGGVLGELAAQPPGVASDDHHARSRVGDTGEDLLREAPGGARDDGAVHPVRPGAEHAAQPCRSELQVAGEAVGEVGQMSVDVARGLRDRGLCRALVPGKQLPQLGAGDGVRVAVDPALGLGSQFGVIHGSRLP